MVAHTSADSSFRDLQQAFSDHQNKDLLVDLIPGVMPSLKSSVKEGSIDKEDADGDEISAASDRVPVAYASIAAYQLKWFFTLIDLQLVGNGVRLLFPVHSQLLMIGHQKSKYVPKFCLFKIIQASVSVLCYWC